jgi:hypothetical protein
LSQKSSGLRIGIRLRQGKGHSFEPVGQVSCGRSQAFRRVAGEQAHPVQVLEDGARHSIVLRRAKTRVLLMEFPASDGAGAQVVVRNLLTEPAPEVSMAPDKESAHGHVQSMGLLLPSARSQPGKGYFMHLRWLM